MLNRIVSAFEQSGRIDDSIGRDYRGRCRNQARQGGSATPACGQSVRDFRYDWGDVVELPILQTLISAGGYWSRSEMGGSTPDDYERKKESRAASAQGRQVSREASRL